MFSNRFHSSKPFRGIAASFVPTDFQGAKLLPALALLLTAAVAGLLWLPPTDPAQAQTEQSERPTITAGPVITSSPANGHTYGQGQTIAVAVTFSEAVTVTGEPRVRLTMGDRTRWARYASSAADGTVLTFTYSVKGNDQDENGISIKKNQLELRDGTIADADGNSAKLKHPALPDQSAHKVDGAPPFITAGPVITSSPASGDAYGEGEAIVVAVTFSEAVTVSGDVRVPLAVGERQRWARYSHSEQAGTVLAFTYRVKKVDADDNGVSIGANRLELRDGSIADAGGNAANLAHPALADQSGHQVNGSPEPEPAHGEPVEPPTPTPTPAPPANSPPRFATTSVALSVAEDAAIGANVGSAVTAADAENDALVYAISGSNAFAVNSASGQIAVQTALDYETQAGYSLTVSVSDGKNAAGEADAAVDDTIAVTVNVTNVDEAGVVSLESETDPPEVGSELRAVLLDPDGGVSGLSWSWARSADGTAWDNVAGASGASYTLAAEDGAHYLQATASYTDAHGPGKTARAALENTVQATVTVQPPEPQAQQSAGSATTVWSATLTVSASDNGRFGCGNAIDADVDYDGLGSCSDAVVLTDNDFTYEAYTYLVNGVSWVSPNDAYRGRHLNLRFESDRAGYQVRSALDSLILNVDGIPLNISAAGHNGYAPPEIRWVLHPNSPWTEGQKVSLSLTTFPPPPSVWSASLTVDEHDGYFGCDNDGDDQDKCSSLSVLTEDDFTYRGVEYKVDSFFWISSSNTIRISFTSYRTLDGTPGWISVEGHAAKTALSSLALHVGESVFAISDASLGTNTQTWLGWTHDPDPDWTDGQTVSLSLVEHPPEIWAATLTVDEHEAYHGCDNTDAADVHDCWPSALTDDEFTYRGVTYTIDGVVWHNPAGNYDWTHGLDLILDANQGRTPTGDELKRALRRLTLNVDGYWLPVSEATAGSGPKLTWKQNLPWTDGSKASLSLHTIGEPTCETPTSTGIRCIVPHDWPLTPDGLDPGESFRLMFVTSTKTAATSTDIADYNSHVQGRADAAADLKPLKDHFRALASTAAVAARANTKTGSGDLGAWDPIYWVKGSKIADNYAALYDGSWDHNAHTGQWPTIETGAIIVDQWAVWTGTTPTGAADSGNQLGAVSVTRGRVNTSGEELDWGGPEPRSKTNHLYGVSPALTVDYDPAAPLQPTGLTASPRDTAVRLMWDEPWHEDPYPDKRQVQWRTHDGTSWGSWGEWKDIYIMSGNNPPRTVYDVGAHVSNGLTNDTRYQFRIRAVAGTHYSAPSEPAEATPQAALLKPTGLVASPADQAVILHWDYPDNDAITAYQYQWRRTTGDNTAWDAWTTMSENSLYNAADRVRVGQNDQPLKFRVRAGTGAGTTGDPRVWSEPSNEEGVPVTPKAAPDPVAAVSVPHDWEALPKASDKKTIVVAPGESFRLLFLTGGTDATSTSISDYNDIAQDAARNPAFSEFKDGFRAMISTAGVHARDNTATVQVQDNNTPPTVTTVWSDELTVAKEGNEYGCNQAWASGRCADLNRQHFGFGGAKYTIDRLYWSSSDNSLVLKITGAANAAAEDALYALTLQVGDNKFAMADGARADASGSNDFEISWAYNPDPDWAAGQQIQLSLTLPIAPTAANSPPVFWNGGGLAVLAGGDPYNSDHWVVSTSAGDDDRVWTGSFRGGYSWTVYQYHHYAGAKHVRVGNHNSADNHIHIDADHGTPLNTTQLPLYALSPVFTRQQPPAQQPPSQ